MKNEDETDGVNKNIPIPGYVDGDQEETLDALRFPYQKFFVPGASQDERF